MPLVAATEGPESCIEVASKTELCIEVVLFLYLVYLYHNYLNFL
jgi:hypothetical protein